MTETPTPNSDGPNTSSDNDRVKASIENWKRKLLDLTKRNRALNFKVNKVSTITIVDEQPAEVFRQLYLRERLMRFKAAPETDAQAEEGAPTREGISAGGSQQLPMSAGEELIAEETSLDGFDEEDEDDGLHSDFVPYDSASLEERHTDDQLQT